MNQAESSHRRQFLGEVGALSLATLVVRSEALARAEKDSRKAFVLENDVLRIELSQADGSFSVMDKRSNQVWRQQMKAGFHVALDSVQATATNLSAKIVGKDATYIVSISFTRDAAHAFDLVIEVPGRRYTLFPGYPFPFAAPAKGWYYVQNTTGEGILMPLEKPAEIISPYSWGGGQPWWGITDCQQAMRARLDTFRLPGREDDTDYAAPLRINYAFFTDGGYVALAKDYRKEFLRGQPEMKPLRERTKARPAVGHLKDGVYVYFWGKNPAEDLKVATEMREAGIERAIAVFYGRHEIDRPTCDGIKKLGWVVGRFQMPTGNLFQVSRKRHWPAALLTGKLAPDRFLADSNRGAWDRVCGKQQLKVWPDKARTVIKDYGVQLFYFDTLVVQLAPCLHPDHLSTIEENQEARRAIMQRTRDLGMLVGSGEGGSPTWALPDLDFFEGMMSLRTYSDTPLSIPGGGFEKDLGKDYDKAAASHLDETRRIPLYQLAFHDFVAGTWVWRDTNFQSTPYQWKKDLFNILYSTMPMWHINGRLWAKHREKMIASYRNFALVRGRIGFAEMMNHGWLTADRSVQFTDWSTQDRVIVNFGDRASERKPKEPIPPRSFAIERVEDR